MYTIVKWFGYGNRDLAAVVKNRDGSTMNSTMVPSVEVGTPRRHKAEKLSGGSERAPESGLYLGCTVPAPRQEGHAARCVYYWDSQWREHSPVSSGTKYTVLCSTMNRPYQGYESSGATPDRQWKRSTMHVFESGQKDLGRKRWVAEMQG